MRRKVHYVFAAARSGGTVCNAASEKCIQRYGLDESGIQLKKMIGYLTVVTHVWITTVSVLQSATLPPFTCAPISMLNSQYGRQPLMAPKTQKVVALLDDGQRPQNLGEKEVEALMPRTLCYGTSYSVSLEVDGGEIGISWRLLHYFQGAMCIDWIDRDRA